MPVVPDFPYTLPLSIYDESTKANIPNPAWISVLEQLRGLVSAAVNKQTDQAGVIFEYQSATECRLKVKGSGLVPLFYRGDLIQVDIGQTANGYVSFSNSGLSANTLYYPYAYYDPGTATVKGEWSTTGHATTSGVETKSGDQTRSLVGMVRTNGSSQFTAIGSAKLVLSWYNDEPYYLGRAAAGNTNVSSTTPVSLLASNIEFVTWGKRIAGWGQSLVTAGTANSIIFLTMDGSAFGLGGYGAASATNQISTVGGVDASEGYHYVNLTGELQSGTSTATHFAAGTGAFIVV